MLVAERINILQDKNGKGLKHASASFSHIIAKINEHCGHTDALNNNQCFTDHDAMSVTRCFAMCDSDADHFEETGLRGTKVCAARTPSTKKKGPHR